MRSSRSIAPTRRTSAPRKRGDDTRTKIIDETVRCIVEEGFAAATAKHVAERAGVTWGVIQYHFGDRNGMLMAVVDDGVARLVDSLSSANVSELALRERIIDCCSPAELNSLLYWLTVVAVLSRANLAAVTDTAVASALLAATARDGMRMARSRAANVSSVPATLLSRLRTQPRLLLHACTLAG